jgi:hypothetical protein
MASQASDGAQSDNLDAGAPGYMKWGPGDSIESAKELLTYVEAEADKAIAWYWRNKRWKARCSRLIQFSAIVLTALAGIFPIVAYLAKDMKWPALAESGLWPSLFVGSAAALIGIDRAFGLSSGWTRYVLTATSIRKLLEEFRLDCALLLLCKSGQNAPDQVSTIIRRAKEFRLAVEEAVFQETKEWATEFQNNVAQLEKDVKAQLDVVKGELDKARSGQALKEPGAVELTIMNANAADGGRVHVQLQGVKGPIADEVLSGGNKWVRIGLSPGQYRVALTATIAGASVQTAAAILVKPGEVTKAEISLQS